jgi:hypothetical protein
VLDSEQIVEAVARAIRIRRWTRNGCGQAYDIDTRPLDETEIEDARAAIAAARPMIEAEAWRPIESAPRDGTWILVRGRNSAGHPMIPVVCAWGTGFGRHASGRWVDSATLSDMSALEADVPHGSMADWCPLPAPPSIEPRP